MAEAHRPVRWRWLPIAVVAVVFVASLGGPVASSHRGLRSTVFELQAVDTDEDASGLRGGVGATGTLRWPADSIVEFVVNPANAPDGAAAAVAAAAETWTSEAELSVEVVSAGSSDLVGATADLVNVVSWVETENPGHTFVARTITYWYADEPDVIIAFDMMFNRDHAFAIVDSAESDGDDEAWDVETVALHEFGHALGLSHTPPERVLRVMRPTLEPGAVQRAPAVRDIAALADLYGVAPVPGTTGFFERVVPVTDEPRRDGIFVGPRELVPADPDAAGLFG